MTNRWNEMGRRPVRVANVSGYQQDPPMEMFRQATLGDVDFLTGDYLAEVNMANNAAAYLRGEHPGWEQSAWEGLRQTIDVIGAKTMKVAINGGALNPRGLAEKVASLARSKGLDLKVAFVSGDDLHHVLGEYMPTSSESVPPHLDAQNKAVRKVPEALAFLSEPMKLASANAYLGARGIVKALQQGADIVICGRCSDASPVIAAAWYWHSWSETDYDALAGSLIAGHLIECSAYVTGGNFAGFDQYDLDTLLRPGFPIAEIAHDGTCVITKHECTGGFINVDTVKCQLLYELQGNIYLNSDVKAYLDNIVVENVGKDRVHVHGVRGAPPPPTTKWAIFYHGGFECQILVNAAGYATDKKWDLFEKQIRYFLGEEKIKELKILQFQRIGTPEINPKSQLSSTTYMRVFATATTEEALLPILGAMRDISLKHFSGFHSSLDFRTAKPIPFNAFYPSTYKQEDLKEVVHFVGREGSVEMTFDAGHPPVYEELEARPSYETHAPVSFRGAFREIRLGDIALARSGDKGSNLNVGLFVQTQAQWHWLRSFMTVARFRELMGEDDSDDFFVERVEFKNILAVHFVVYGILGRGVSSTSRLDGFGKGFADFFRDKLVQVPEEIL